MYLDLQRIAFVQKHAPKLSLSELEIHRNKLTPVKRNKAIHAYYINKCVSALNKFESSILNHTSALASKTFIYNIRTKDKPS